MNKMMRPNKILVSLMAVLALFLILAGTVQATEELDITVEEVTINNVDALSVDSIAVFAGETIPVKIVFTANEDAEDVRVKAEINGYRKDISGSTERFDMFENGTYEEVLSLKVPEDIDSDESLVTNYRLSLRVVTKDKEYNLEDLTVRVQRESYNLEILSVEAQPANAGNIMQVDVVVKNMGMHKMNNIFVDVSIPSLQVSRTVYMGDLLPQDSGDNGSDNDDTVLRRVFLIIPSETEAGNYILQVEAYNKDESVASEKLVLIQGVGTSDVLTSISSKQMAVGEEVVYELLLVNPTNSMKIYNIVPEQAENLIVNVDEQLVTISAGSSKVVKVRVKANAEGTYSFGVNVYSDNELVKRASLNATVEGGNISNPAVILTVVLAIVFVVLLIVLIVLLTRKPQTPEEFNESYY